MSNFHQLDPNRDIHRDLERARRLRADHLARWLRATAHWCTRWLGARLANDRSTPDAPRSRKPQS